MLCLSTKLSKRAIRVGLGLCSGRGRRMEVRRRRRTLCGPVVARVACSLQRLLLLLHGHLCLCLLLLLRRVNMRRQPMLGV